MSSSPAPVRPGGLTLAATWPAWWSQHGKRSTRKDSGSPPETSPAEPGWALARFYRHIPNLDELLAAILFDAIAEMTTQAVHALADPDPWEGFARFAEVFVQLRVTSCGLHDALSSDHDRAIDAEVASLRQAVGRLVRHAQKAGALRGDIDWRDVPFVLASAIPADHTIGIPAKQDQWRRNLAIILAGCGPDYCLLRPPQRRLSDNDDRRAGNQLASGIAC